MASRNDLESFVILYNEEEEEIEDDDENVSQKLEPEDKKEDEKEVEKEEGEEASPVYLPEFIPKGCSRRLILIDGFNMMHAGRNILPDSNNPLIVDERMNPLILVPLVLNFVKHDWNVRVVLRNMPPDDRCSNSYILRVLENIGLVHYPEEDDVEQDDLHMLKMAREYGAIIITNDQFRNHVEFAKEAEENCLEYEVIKNASYSIESLKKRLAFKKTIALHDDWKICISSQDQPDYHRVLKSQKQFELDYCHLMLHLTLLELYVYSLMRYIYNYGLPSQTDFLHYYMVSFPMVWEDFYQHYRDYKEEVERKARSGRILSIKAPEGKPDEYV